MAPYDRGPVDDESGAPQVNLLAIAWQARWLIVLGMLLGGLGAWAYPQQVTPRYTSVSRVFVERGMSRLLGADLAAAGAQSAKWLFTQAELMKSTPVLAAVVERPEVQKLETIRGAENPVGLLRSGLVVGIGKDDEIINVSLEIPSAADAAVIVNAVVDTYIATYAEQRRSDTIELLRVLRKEKARYEVELDERRTALDDFRRRHVTLSVQVNNDNVINRRFAGLSEELNATELELLQAKARYNRAVRMYETPSQRPYLLEMATGESASTRTSDLARQVRELEQTLLTERSRWGEGFPRVRLLRESLEGLKDELEQQRAAVIEAFVEALRQEYELLGSRRDELQRAFDKQFELATEVSGQSIELESLQDAVASAAREAESLDEQIRKLDLTEEVGDMKVNVMEVAGVSTLPTYPSRQKFLAAGIALGGMLGFGLAFLRDLLDQRFRSVEEITRSVQLPVVGVIPLQSRVDDRREWGRVVALEPRCPAAEAVRTLRTSLYLSLAARDSKVFMVTSPAPGDGKSTVASNLAIAMAQVGQRVLLIDADMRKPTQHEIFAASDAAGLSSVLSTRAPADECVLATSVPSLDLLPCGPRPANPVELLNDGYFATLLDELSQRYDRIVIDSPPILPVADARVIAALADCTLLVLRADRSTRRGSASARDELWRVRARRIGVVVNGVPPRKHGSYSGYGYGDGSAYGYGYGHDIDEAERGDRQASSKRRLRAERGVVTGPAAVAAQTAEPASTGEPG